MTLLDRPLHDVLAAFRAPTPTPGGGSASALAGALGAALLAMVAALPKNRAASDADRERLQAAAARCQALSASLARAVDEDSAAYEEVMAAYRLPKGSDPEKAQRTARIQDALLQAVDVPLDVMRQCAESAEISVTIAALGNRNAASDAGVGLELLAAACRGARANVGINLAAVKDGAFVERASRDASALAARCERAIAAALARSREPA